MPQDARSISVRSAAEACEEEKAAQHDWDGVDWMTEKQHEALDGSDLDKEESEADRQEVEGDSPSGETSSSGLPAIAAERQQGCKDQDKTSAAAWTSVAASTR